MIRVLLACVTNIGAELPGATLTAAGRCSGGPQTEPASPPANRVWADSTTVALPLLPRPRNNSARARHNPSNQLVADCAFKTSAGLSRVAAVSIPLLYSHLHAVAGPASNAPEGPVDRLIVIAAPKQTDQRNRGFSVLGCWRCVQFDIINHRCCGQDRSPIRSARPTRR